MYTPSRPWWQAVRGPLVQLPRAEASIGTRQAEDVLRDVAEDEIVRHRRHRVEPRLAKLPFHVVVGGKPVPAEGVEARVGRLPRGLGGEQFGHVCLCTAG